MVSKILPFLLLGGFSKAEIIAYLKAKLAAAKEVMDEILQVEKDEDADFIIGVNIPCNEQKDLCMDNNIEECAESKASVEDLVDGIWGYINKGYTVGILDIAFANGGDGKLADKMLNKIPLYRIAGYAAWNTASNSLGTILSQMSAYMSCNENLAEIRNFEFTLERIFDDYIYQSKVRRNINERLEAGGLNIWKLDEYKASVEMEVKEAMDLEIKQFVKNVFEKGYSGMDG